jgi:hypothetical protein
MAKIDFECSADNGTAVFGFYLSGRGSETGDPDHHGPERENGPDSGRAEKNRLFFRAFL